MKKKNAQTKRVQAKQNVKSPQWHSTVQEAYAVAGLVFERGYEPSEIAREMWPTEWKDTNPALRSKLSTRVGRLIAYGMKHKVLLLSPASVPHLEQQLSEKYNGIKFHVFEDRHVGVASSLHVAAAKIINDYIKDCSLKNPSPIIGNSGGPTIGRTIAHLAALSPTQNANLTFLSLNDVCFATSHDMSASYLAVAMSQIYGCKHLVVTRLDPRSETYESAMEDLDLIILGAGNFLRRWLKLQDVKGSVSKRIVGDIAFIPIDEDGVEVKLKPDIAGKIKEIAPRPTLTELKQLARKRKVLVTFAKSPDASSGPLEKLPIARAVLRRHLASDVLMSEELGRALLKSDD